MYCKLIRDTYKPSVMPSPPAGIFKWPWRGSYDSFIDPAGRMVRIGVIIQTKSISIDAAHKWLNTYLIEKYKRTHRYDSASNKR